MNPSLHASATHRDLAVRHLRQLTVGTAFAGVVAVGVLGAAASVTSLADGAPAPLLAARDATEVSGAGVPTTGSTGTSSDAAGVSTPEASGAPTLQPAASPVTVSRGAAHAATGGS
jgi:hypothetical protein